MISLHLEESDDRDLTVFISPCECGFIVGLDSDDKDAVVGLLDNSEPDEWPERFKKFDN